METNVAIEKTMEGKKPSLFGIITSPSVQFERMKNKAPVGVPLVIMVLLMAIATALVSYLSLNNPIVKNAVAAGGVKIPASFTVISGVIGGLIGGVIGFLISGAFFKLCMVFMGNDTPYKKVLSIVIHASIISTLGLLVNAVIALVVGGYDVTYTSLAPLFTESKMLQGIAKCFDIFQIWYFVVLTIGLRFTAGLSKNKAISLVVILFLIGVGFSALSGIFMKTQGI